MVLWWRLWKIAFCSNFSVLHRYASVNSTCAQAPRRATEGHLHALSVPGVGHLQILHCAGAGHSPTPGPFPRFWHARGFLSEYDYTEGFTGKKSRLAHLSRTGINWRGLERHVLDFMHAFLHCLSSQNYIAKLELLMWINVFLVVESNFCSYYLKNILSHL